jgi:hypothetical protein
MTRLLLALALLAPPAQPGDGQALLEDGIRLVDEGDLETAVAVLSEATARLDAADARERALAHLYLGMAQLGLDQAAAARDSLATAWRLNGGAALDPRRFPPRVVRLYGEAGESLGPSEKPDTRSRKRTLVVASATAGAALGAGLASAAAGNGSSGRPPAPGPPVAEPPAAVTVRAYNCDDIGRVFLGGTLVGEVGIGEDSGLVDVTSRLRPGPNEIVFELFNDHALITYGFEVRLGDAIVFQQTCGIVHRVGCENDSKFPPGVIRRFTHVVHR